MCAADRQPATERIASLRDSLKAALSPATPQLLQEALRPDPDFLAIAAILKLDPALAAAILGLVNSPHYGQTEKISNLHRAAFILGNNEILRIALSLCIQQSLSTLLTQQGFDAFANWRVLIWSAIGAEMLATQLAPNEAEAAYICTLVKDLALLVYAANFPEALRNVVGLQDFVRANPILFRDGPDSMEHAEMTALFLREWNFPPALINAVTAHHDVEHLFEQPPLTQAVILATFWAEAEFRDDPAPDALGQFAFLLNKLGILPKDGIDGLRARCAKRFTDLCAAMHIHELPPHDRWYETPLQAIQDFHYQARELESLPGGNAAVAACIARHLQWNWNCRQVKIILPASQPELWELFVLKNGEAAPPINIATQSAFSKPGDTSYPLQNGTRVWGELRLPPPDNSPRSATEIPLYARLAAGSYARRHATIRPLEVKAELLDILPAGIALLSNTGHILHANPLFFRYLNNTVDITGRHLPEVLSTCGLLHEVQGWLEFLCSEARTSHCIITCPLGPDSCRKNPCFTLSSYKIHMDGHACVLVLLQDLSEIRILEAEALRQRSLLNQLIASMRDLVLTIDQHGTITFASGRHGSYLRGKNLFAITRPVSPSPQPWTLDTLEDSATAIEAQIVLDDEHLLLELLFSPLPDGEDHGLVVGRDISAIRRLERTIKEQALFDSLTRVFNRHHLLPTMEREIVRARRTNLPLGLLFFDIDRFKQFNDAHGHQRGDLALKNLGQLLRDRLRKGMDFPCRFGGDEFVIVASSTDQESLVGMAERIGHEFCAQNNGQMSLSIGITLLEPEDTPQSLLERCDKAGYQAKASGGNTIVHLQTTTPS